MMNVTVGTAMGTYEYMAVYELKSDGVFLVGKYNSLRGNFVYMFPLEVSVVAMAEDRRVGDGLPNGEREETTPPINL